MKKLMLGLLAATLFAVPNARAGFEGVLKAGQQTTITLSPVGNTGTVGAATVLGAKKSRLVVLGTLTAPDLGTAQLVLPSLGKVNRVIITVDTAGGNASVDLEVAQGTIDVHFQVTGHGDFVWDVTP